MEIKEIHAESEGEPGYADISSNMLREIGRT
jgi:hypothetical protein